MRGYICFFKLREFTQQFLLPLGKPPRHFDIRLDRHVTDARTAVWIRQTGTRDAKDLARLRTGRDGQRGRPVQSRYFDDSAQRGLGVGDRQLEDQVLPLTLKQLVFADVNEAVDVAPRSAVRAGLTFGWDAD